MAEATHHAWSDVRLEQLTPLLSRKVLTGDRAMVAQVFLKKGSIVKAHEHHNEQVTYILEGALRFWLGENADKAPNAPYVDVRAGEVLLIPGNVRHEAHALEDTLDLDFFTPPRADWLDGSDAYIREQK
ncbi:MAG: cupin domain-containing protein [bacterium]|jgi:quercetin dioxygenase-like cupin family protein|nr:cupin domain-containing protein [Gemmatimonadota bacterium]NBW66690.1 cupin domain-containing protein [bacterium]